MFVVRIFHLLSLHDEGVTFRLFSKTPAVAGSIPAEWIRSGRPTVISLDGIMVITSDFESDNQGSIPCRANKSLVGLSLPFLAQLVERGFVIVW